MTFWDTVSLALRTVIASVFITYGISKLRDVYVFAATLQQYKLLPNGLLFLTARFLPIAEIGLGVLLLFNLVPTVIVTGVALLLLVFSSALVRLGSIKDASVKGCGCGGSTTTSTTSIRFALGRNVILLMMAVGVFVISSNREANYSLTFLAIELFVLLGILVYSFFLSDNWLPRVSLRLKDWRSKTLNAYQVEQITNSRSRRNFLKVTTLSVVGVLAFLSLRDAPTVEASGEGCGCARSGTYFSTNPDCSCCHPNYPATCIGSANRWEIWKCEDGTQCDAVPAGQGPYLCYCAQP
jgi:Methylamine utilisation protein MauE